MKKNVGQTDRYIRFILGLAALLNIPTLEVGVVGAVVFLVISLAMFYSSFSGYCALYSILNIDTSVEKEPEQAAPVSHGH